MSERLRFAPPKPAPKGLWRRVPPMIFTPILGLMSLALAWRAAMTQFALPAGLSGLLDGVAVALFLFAATAYAVKLLWRPAVLADDARGLAVEVLDDLGVLLGPARDEELGRSDDVVEERRDLPTFAGKLDRGIVSCTYGPHVALRYHHCRRINPVSPRPPRRPRDYWR